MLKANIELTHEKAAACAENLKQVCERLSGVIDFSPLFGNLTPEGIIVAAIAGAPPAKCVTRVRTMLGGGFAGLRAFCHLATEAATIQLLGFDPFLETTPLEAVLKDQLQGKTAEEKVLLRHQALFDQPVANGVWAKAHLDAYQAELALMEYLMKTRMERAPDRGLLFWYDPGLTEEEINLNADLTLKVGLVTPPRSAAPRGPYHKAYAELAALANG